MDHRPGWMSGSDRAFEELLRDVAWSQRRRWMYDREVDEPRLTSWQRIDEQTAVAYQWLEDARVSLSARYEVRFDSVGINLYRDGADSVAWHRDRIPPEIVDPVVALVSLGEPRTFLLRPQGGGRSRRFQARSWRPARHRRPDAAPLRAQRPESEVVGPTDEHRVQARRRLTAGDAPADGSGGRAGPTVNDQPLPRHGSPVTGLQISRYRSETDQAWRCRTFGA